MGGRSSSACERCMVHLCPQSFHRILTIVASEYKLRNWCYAKGRQLGIVVDIASYLMHTGTRRRIRVRFSCEGRQLGSAVQACLFATNWRECGFIVHDPVA